MIDKKDQQLASGGLGRRSFINTAALVGLTAGVAALGLSLQAATPAVSPTRAAVLMKLRRPRPAAGRGLSFLSVMVFLFGIAQLKRGGARAGGLNATTVRGESGV